MRTFYGFISCILLMHGSGAYAQQPVADSIVSEPVKLTTIEITAYPSGQALATTPASVSILDSAMLRFRTQPTLVSSLNTIPGVRMEERSPGSYRLSLRGSLLRSPYGVRNVKIYMDDFPLTDGGGNTYLNSIDISGNSRVEIIKGPDGSLFGANTGGVVHIIPSGINEAQRPELTLNAGSYGAFYESAAAGFRAGKHLLGVEESYYRADGYRDNSAMHKAYVTLSDKWTYSGRGTLKLFLSYSDLYYQTPGGLTLQQQDADPAGARPGTATLPSAAAQKAAVYTKLLFAGITHKIALGEHLRHVIAAYGSMVDFKNPFITNYEVRKEATAGFRTYLELHDIKAAESNFHYTFHIGAEWTQTRTDVHNYDNNYGVKGSLQATDRITAAQYFFFTRANFTLSKRWTLESALSLGYSGYNFNEQQPSLKASFDPQWMPKLGVSYKAGEHIVWRALVSRGYSTPTTAEIRPANNMLYLALQPEHGWNYETGIRIHALQHRCMVEGNIFYYRLNDAIVSHLDNNGNAFFTNAGGTRQAGIETNISCQLIKGANTGNIITGLFLFNNTTFNAFYFRDYKVDDKDYSGNRLTGVPAVINVLGIRCDFIKGFDISATYNHTGNVPLNDANTTFADAYNLVQANIGKRFQIRDISVRVHFGIDNTLNETYSLGNDINAAGARYYNPAPARNFIAGLKMVF